MYGRVDICSARKSVFLLQKIDLFRIASVTKLLASRVLSDRDSE